MLCSMPPESQAREQHRLLVVGNNDDKVTIVHPAPQYPYDGQRMRIQGDVQVRVQVDRNRNFTLSDGRF